MPFLLQCVVPFFVATKLSKIRRSSFFIPNSLTYVRSALRTVGVESVTFGYFAHALEVSGMWKKAQGVETCVEFHEWVEALTSLFRTWVESHAQKVSGL